MQRAAWTYSFCFSPSTEARVMRENWGMLMIARAMAALVTPGPSTAATAMPSRIAGKASSVSQTRMMQASSQPPL
jgi:hypothetical protein